MLTLGRPLGSWDQSRAGTTSRVHSLRQNHSRRSRGRGTSSASSTRARSPALFPRRRRLCKSSGMETWSRHFVRDIPIGNIIQLKWWVVVMISSLFMEVVLLLGLLSMTFAFSSMLEIPFFFKKSNVNGSPTTRCLENNDLRFNNEI